MHVESPTASSWFCGRPMVAKSEQTRAHEDTRSGQIRLFRPVTCTRVHLSAPGRPPPKHVRRVSDGRVQNAPTRSTAFRSGAKQASLYRRVLATRHLPGGRPRESSRRHRAHLAPPQLRLPRHRRTDPTRPHHQDVAGRAPRHRARRHLVRTPRPTHEPRPRPPPGPLCSSSKTPPEICLTASGSSAPSCSTRTSPARATGSSERMDRVGPLHSRGSRVEFGWGMRRCCSASDAAARGSPAWVG